MIKHTEWRPHHCKCVIVYSWDTEEIEDVRKHTIMNHQHCGEDHPHARVGEQLEGSEFHEYHKAMNKQQEELERKLVN